MNMRRPSEGVNNGGRMILFILMASRVHLCSSKVTQPAHWEGQKSMLATFYICYCYCYLFILMAYCYCYLFILMASRVQHCSSKVTLLVHWEGQKSLLAYF